MLGRILVILFLVVGLCSVKAQDATVTTEQLIADIFEQYTSQTEGDIDYASFYEDLMYCAQHPIQLNTATKEELEKLPFLSDIQIENILAYIYKNEHMQTIYELQLIEGLDMTDIRRMLPFVTVGEKAETSKKIYWNELMKYGKNEILIRLDKGLESKEGYQLLPAQDAASVTTNAKKYTGNSLYHALKYRYDFENRILVGFTAEKDAGEQFIGKTHKGYDFYSAYAQLNEMGKLKTLVVGDYKANFGQGLVLRSEVGMGKSAYVLNVSPRNSGLKKYSSTDESNFFRGVGATLRFGRVQVTAFYSNKALDADTANGSFTSIYRTGLHRTLDEIQKKHTVNQQVIGGNCSINFSKLLLGFTAVHTQLDNRLQPEAAAYNYHYFVGSQQTVAGVHYRIRMAKLNFFGETAMADNASVATLNGVTFSPLSQVSLVALHRYYSPKYDTFYATAFSETSRINNETGFYIGTEIRPFAKWKIAAYADSYRFPWLKFGIDAPSLGTDYLLQLDFAPRRNTSMYWRFKYEDKQQNQSASDAVMPVIVANKKASLRYNLVYSFGNFSFKNVLEANLSRISTSNWTYGMLALQDVSYTFSTLPLKLDVRLQLFDATDYENRLYSYEKDVLYAFSIPMYVGQGSRYYLNLQYDISSKLSLWLKIAQTVYADDRDIISSGNETINGNRKTDARMVVKWSF